MTLPGEPEEDIVPEPSGPLVGEAPISSTRALEAPVAEWTGRPQPPPQVAPLVSARPLARVQRASEAPPEPVRQVVERRTGVDLREVKVHREASTATAARQMSARAFTTGGEVHVPADHGSLEASEGRTLVAHDLVHAAQQRRLGPALPAERTSDGQGLETEARSMESAWRAAPEMPLVSRAPAEPGAPPAPIVDPATAAVAAGIAQRQADGSVTFHAPPSEPVAPVQRVEEAAPVTAVAPEPQKEEDMEELANKLYEPMTRLLRQELRDLRERAGRLADL
ncbi:MAG TPA: DUF4157 domain-containing protein [Actinomycetota bacterium]|nr:DUF4157 domain-containing protein [Actinomycetota bacterium]